MKQFTIKMIDKVLSFPLIFEWQQKVCNTYTNVRAEFDSILNTKDKDILEVGCSTGTCAGQIVDMDKNRYIGIDIVPEYIRIAQEHYPLGRFLVMDARKLDFPDNHFDIVLFNGAMHHLDDTLIKDCLKDIRRVLKKDGVLLTSEPLFTPGSWLSNFLLSLDRGKYIRTVEGYRALFDGFQVEREGFFRFSFHRFCSFVLKPK